MNDCLENLRNNIDVRQSILTLKEIVRSEKSGKTLAQLLAGDFSVLTDLLQHEDPKVRKNVVLVMGEMECEPFRDMIWDLYQKESILYVRADYLKALAHYDCTPYLEAIRERMVQLEGMKATPEEEKHYYSEQTAIKSVLRKSEKAEKHKFTGFKKRLEVILLTNREHRDMTVEQLQNVSNVRMLAGGVRFIAEDLRKILPIRTYSEMLFPIPGTALLDGSPGNIARQLVQAGMLKFLDECHEEMGPYYFRLDIKSPLPDEQRIDLLKKVARALEKESAGQLLNAPGGYEIEIRLVANKEGRFVPLLKLFTLQDHRFVYRKEVLPTSIAPVNAALIMEMAKDYLMHGAMVLDPFCGVGTMLIERRHQGSVTTLYGVDIMEEAIKKAKENALLAHFKVHYVQRDFLEFRPQYPFDEIVTNLPAVSKYRSKEDVTALYDYFLGKIPQLLNKGGITVAYSASYEILRSCLRKHPELKVLKEFCLNERDGSSAVVFKY